MNQQTQTLTKSDIKFLNKTDAELRAVADGANLPTLMAALMAYRGEPIFMDGTVKTENILFMDMNSGLTDELAKPVQDRAFQVLKELRDNNIKPAKMPTQEEFYKILDFYVGGEVAANVKPLFWEEFLTYTEQKDQRGIRWSKSTSNPKPGFKVLIIGGGTSGILSAMKLEEAGVNYLLVDKNATLGGTWTEARYPGAGVDSNSAAYCFSFEPNYKLKHYYAQRDEVYQYWNDCADKYHIRKKVRLSVSVQDLKWDEAKKEWKVVLKDEKNGTTEVLFFNAVYCCIGQLNKWKIPSIPGIENYEGTYFHAANWNDVCDLSGKKVVLVGTGATSIQLAPAIADKVQQLTIVQRTPQWFRRNNLYKLEVSDVVRDALVNMPYYGVFFRILALFKSLDKFDDLFGMDPNRVDKLNTASPLNDQVRKMLTDYIREKTGDDEKLFQQLLPDYPPFGTRILQDAGWVETLQKNNVTLVSGALDAFEKNSVVVGDKHIEAEVVIFATGYTPLNISFEITGLEGKKLSDEDVWGSKQNNAQAYLGITVPDFPNFFLMYGPNTNIGSGAVPFNCELQVRYANKCIQYLIENNIDAMSLKQEPLDQYMDYVDDCLSKVVYCHPKSNSWYNTGKNGRSFTNMPFSNFTYWEMTKEPIYENYNRI